MAQKHIFIFGLGYVGQHLAHSLSARGWQITGTTRAPEKLKENVPANWQIVQFDTDTPVPDLAAHLSSCSHLLTTISPLSGLDPVMTCHKEEISDFVGWCGYVSATSVYPDQGQGFVDETVMPAPATQRGRNRLEAEIAWQAVCCAEIFRVAGIYGPGRNVLEAFAEGRARIIEHEGQLSNRIHLRDIAKIILAAIDQPRPGRIINLCDDEPAAQGDVVRFAARLLGVDPPQPVSLEQADLSDMARSFYVSKRRLRSVLVGPELGVVLDYPTYREGLRALFSEHQKL